MTRFEWPRWRHGSAGWSPVGSSRFSASATRRSGAGSAAAISHRRLPGVYAVGHTAPSIQAELTGALLYAGPGAMLSHATGAWWLGLTDRRPAATELSTPRRRRPREGIVVHDRCDLQRSWHRDLPVAPVPEVLLGYAASAEPDRLRRALAEAEYRGWLDVAELHGRLGRGRPGSAALRGALADHEPVVVELDGRDGHVTWAQIQRDRDRDLRLRAAGFTVLRYGWRQLTKEPEAVAADIMAALAAREAGRRETARSS